MIMKKFLFILMLGICSLSLTSCVTGAYAETGYYGDDIEVVLRLGTPYYYDGALYYFYNGYYFYPYRYGTSWRYYRYATPPRHHRPQHHGDIHHGHVHHGGHHATPNRPQHRPNNPGGVRPNNPRPHGSFGNGGGHSRPNTPSGVRPNNPRPQGSFGRGSGHISRPSAPSRSSSSPRSGGGHFGGRR